MIGEEGREAYNSLIERKTTLIGTGVLSPAASLLSKLDTNEFELTSAKTLPRCSLQQFCEDEAPSFNPARNISNKQLTIPLQNAPRPMTLPTRGAAGKLRKSELFINASKLQQRAALVDSKNMTDTVENDENCNITANSSLTGKNPPCESPSYLINTSYTFLTKNTDSITQFEQTQQPANIHANPIPLPPREGKKHIKTNPKRHVRKYPLIIPAYGVQRTLNKVTEVTPIDDDELKNSTVNISIATDHNLSHTELVNQKDCTNIKLRGFTHEVVATVRPTTRNSAYYEKTSRITNEISQRSYQNVQDIQKCKFNETSMDSASLQFESILEDDFNKVNVLQSPDVADGFYNFSIQKERYNKCKDVDFDKSKISGLYVNEDELRNLDIEKNLNIVVTDTAAAFGGATASTTILNLLKSQEDNHNATTIAPKICLATANDSETMANSSKSESNELADHALFKKVRESVDLAMENNENDAALISRPISACGTKGVFTDLVDGTITNRMQTNDIHQQSSVNFEDTAVELKNSNSVSCEDLLEFSDKKPKGCERGVDSDEVRIMMKVLGKNTTPTRCLLVLEFIDWDVHKAIKLIKLQNILGATDLSLSESVHALQKHDWDLHITAMKQKRNLK